MSKIDVSNVPEKERFPGFHGRFVHTDTMTFAFWRIDQGAAIPEHDHPHEQVVHPIEGQLELIVAGERHLMSPGSVYVIPGGVRHSARALTPVRVLDVFQPVREDYR